MTDINKMTELPTEVLGEIFLQCSVLDPDAPIFLSTICRTFWSVTRTIPHVWGRLRLTLSGRTQRGCARKAEGWFMMSGTCMLDVSVQISQLSPAFSILGGPEDVGVRPLFDVLRANIDRITSLSLRATYNAQAQSFLNSYVARSVTCKKIALRELTLDTKTALAYYSYMFPYSASGSHIIFPSLSDLVYFNVTNHIFPNISSSNLCNLRTLVVCGSIQSEPIPLHKIIDTLRTATQLIYLSIESRLIDYKYIKLEPPLSQLVSLPFLSYLSLRVNNLPSLLGRLVVPVLKTLRLDDLDGKRAGSSEETGRALLHLLDHMDAGKSDGVQTLSLVNVEILDERDGIWEQCSK